MARCKLCDARGILLSVDNNGVCNKCRALIYPQIHREREIIQESQAIIESSKNWKTKLTRYGVIAEMLGRLQKYEQKGIQGLFTQPIPQCLREIQEDRERLIQEVVEETETKARDRAEVASTVATKVSAAKRGIQALHKLQEEVGEHPAIDHAKAGLKEYAREIEFTSYIDAAQKAEFKRNHKKALDQYLEALYALKTDNVPDETQAKTIAELEEKIAALKSQVGK